MITCPNCESGDIRILEQFDDGDDIINAEIECMNCYAVNWVNTSEDEIEESDYD